MASIHQVQSAGGISWQNTIRARLMERQEENETHRELIEQYQRLSKTVRELKKRNRALLRGGVGPSNAGDGPNPLLAHLDEQINELKNELAAVYRTQAASQNKQLTLSDALRDRDEEVRGLREEVRELREARDGGTRRERDWEDRWKARTKDMEVLNDELLSLNLELNTVSQRNNALQADNASLLQRWIDKMNLTAEEMNDDFEKESGGNAGAGQGKGKGKANGDGGEGGDFRNGGKTEGERGAIRAWTEGQTAESDAPSPEEWDIIDGKQETSIGTAGAGSTTAPVPSLGCDTKDDLDASSVLVEDELVKPEDDADDGWEEARREA